MCVYVCMCVYVYVCMIRSSPFSRVQCTHGAPAVDAHTEVRLFFITEEANELFKTEKRAKKEAKKAKEAAAAAALLAEAHPTY